MHLENNLPSFFKKIPSDFNILIHPPTKSEIDNYTRYAKLFAFENNNDLGIDFGKLRAFRLLKNRKNYLEIGTWDKSNLAYISSLLGVNGTLIDIDVCKRVDKTNLLTQEISDNKLHTIIGDSIDKKTVNDVNKICEPKSLDGIFIDGNICFSRLCVL